MKEGKKVSTHRKGVAVATVAVGAAMVLAFSACSSPSSGGGTPSSSGPVAISFWHSTTGPGATTIQQLVDQFNSDNAGKIVVTASYQGSYAQAQTKYTAAVQSKSTPSVMAMNDISTGFMIDSKQTVPVYQLAANDSSFSTSDIPAASVAYYSDDKGLLAMPFAVSQPMLYINPTMAQAAGLDPTNPPTTFDQFAQWAQQIKDKTGNYGMTMNMGDSWILEELTASGGELFCTPENGRGSGQVTDINVTSPTQIGFMTTLQKLFQDGAALNAGTATADEIAAFTAGKVGLVLTSSASYTALKSGEGSSVVVAPFPEASSSPDGGAAIGGAALWIDGPGHSTAEQQASYEFAKFMDSAESQAAWSASTGYLSSNTGSASLPAGQTALADPNVQVMYNEFNNNPASQASSGCRMGPYAAVRATVIAAFDQITTGTDPTTAMQQAEVTAKSQIAQYNSELG